jgi:hypothetical protein
LPSASEINALCGAESVVEAVPNATGAFVATMVVHQEQRTFSGGPINCGQSDCVILFLDLVGEFQELVGWAVAPITFGPPTPTSTGQCKDRGWRNFANDEGKPFPNQGQCVSYVVAHTK